MRKVNKLTAAVLLAAVVLFPVPVGAISAQKAILLDAETGRVIYEKDADSRSLIASTTKIMTALIICEQCNVLDRMRIPREAVGIEGSSMYLQEGEILSIQELLYGLMLRSGNDAAVALAIYCGGTVEGFAQLMNDKARMLGMIGTHFENPNGLDSPGHYSTARDLAILASYAMDNPVFAKTVSAKTVTIGKRTLTNHNKLLWRLEGADGVKTGFTRAAGRILVSSAVRQNRRLIAVTINAPDDWNDHRVMLEDGFERYKPKQLICKGDYIGSSSVLGGENDTVELLAAEDFCYAVSDDEAPYVIPGKPEFAFAPVVAGQNAGYAYVCIGDKTIGKISMVYGQTVEQPRTVQKSWWIRFLERIK